jgi:delta-aminolevulinic acid dehydratase/porphobilinogen synthase
MDDNIKVGFGELSVRSDICLAQNTTDGEVGFLAVTIAQLE